MISLIWKQNVKAPPSRDILSSGEDKVKELPSNEICISVVLKFSPLASSIEKGG